MNQNELKENFRYVLEKYNDVLLSLRSNDNQFMPGACENVLKAYDVLMAMTNNEGDAAAAEIRQRIDEKAPLGDKSANDNESFGIVWKRTVLLIEEYKKLLNMSIAISDKELIFDFSKLRGTIYEKYRNITNFTREVQINRMVMQDKLNGERQFKQKEIYRIMQALEIPFENIEEYFFRVKK